MGFTDGSLHQTMNFIIGLSNLMVPKPWFTVLLSLLSTLSLLAGWPVVVLTVPTVHTCTRQFLQPQDFQPQTNVAVVSAADRNANGHLAST